ncbi:DUF2851 family protein [Chondrinema litorale]|uniref:DUF2851 family protein n=1 Tax=Chondrinema litorale TaxID=2994555 RepID=UPI002543E904|nr:DUF2851 family protein [Chondrinema litorale]UZR93187.1 DUF2851 family protein [Chondrinema litorale]
MQEAFLHYIWKLQYFNPSGLKTTCGLEIEILAAGQHNLHAGPDFSNAKIKIGNIIWAGNVEIHINSSDWHAHKHHLDAAYNNVILHVVWLDKGKKAATKAEVELPILELKPLVNENLVSRYNQMLESDNVISCASDFFKVPEIYRNFMLEKVLVERLEKKADAVLQLLASNKTDWEETAYQLLMQKMGFKTNNENFLQLAKAIPHHIIKKHNQLFQIEALLFGQAGFLDAELNDNYFIKLKKEYNYLSAKFNLSAKKLQVKEWQFMRLRPANFPTVRIAQAAAMLFKFRKIFDMLTNQSNPLEIIELFHIKQSAYWQKHYHFDKILERGVPAIGKLSRELLIINVVAPLLFARSRYLDKPESVQIIFDLLLNLPAEDNHIIKHWKQANTKVSNAYESQAYLELLNIYCKKKQCLQCRIGCFLLGKKYSELAVINF